jgi:hypothetical protein
LPNSSWPGIIKIFPPRESFVSDIPAGDGKTVNLFYSVAAMRSSYKLNILNIRCGCAKVSIAAYTHEPESLYPPNISHLPIIPPSLCFVLLLLPGLKTDIFRRLKALPPYTSTYSRLQYTGSGRDKLKDVAEIYVQKDAKIFYIRSLKKRQKE